MSEFLANRKEDWEQLKYILKHKADVYKHGRELGVPRMQLLLHDRTKFNPKAWTPYREYFFGEDGFYDQKGNKELIPEDVVKDFTPHKIKHYISEDHHMYREPRDIHISDIPKNVQKEMLADWYSVSKSMSKKPLPPIRQ